METDVSDSTVTSAETLLCDFERVISVAGSNTSSSVFVCPMYHMSGQESVYRTVGKEWFCYLGRVPSDLLLWGNLLNLHSRHPNYRDRIVSTGMFTFVDKKEEPI